MITEAELTLASGNNFQVEIHEIQSDTLGRVHRGKFKSTQDIITQLKKDELVAGSWRDLKEMTIEFTYRNVNYECLILVDLPMDEFASFRVVGNNSL